MFKTDFKLENYLWHSNSTEHKYLYNVMYHAFKNKKYAFLIFVRQSIPFSIELNDMDYGYENLKF